MIDLGSVHPLDIGLDLRELKGMPVRFSLAPSKTYRIKHASGEVSGSAEEICIALVANGYSVVAARSPDGRDITATIDGFAVQPRNDHYWLEVPTLADAFEAHEHPENHR